jgi:hypothetical protein
MDSRLTLAIFNWLFLFGLSLFLMLWRKPLSSKDWTAGRVGYFLLLASALVVWKWRSICYEGEINVDESSYIAAAQRFCVDWMPWRSVDMGSTGPLSVWLYAWAPVLGVKMGYSNLRLMGAALQLLTLGGMFAAVDRTVGRRFAFLLTLFPASVFLFSMNMDFVTFSMEIIPSCILAWLVFFIFKEGETGLSVSEGNPGVPWGMFWIGLLGGALPFTKIQTSLMGLYLTGGFVFLKWMQCRAEGKLRQLVRPLCFLAAGGLTPALFILLPVVMSGVWPVFWHLYISTNLAYKASQSGGNALHFLYNGCADFGTHGFWALVLSVAGIGWAVFKAKAVDWKGWIPVALLLLGFDFVALYSVLRSGFYFPHYLILLMVPLAATMTWCLSLVFRYSKAATATPADAAPAGLGMVASILGTGLIAQGITFMNESSKMPMFLRDWGQATHPLVPVLNKYAQPGDMMAIWGWANKLHVYTGLLPATREAAVGAVADPNPINDKQREWFMQDLKAYKPKIFLDAIDEFRWPTWPAGTMARHFGWLELSNYIRTEYHLVADVPTGPGKLPALVYVRNEDK